MFVDQDAVPTLVEVKRSSDTRIRREVVGQMLDYAANGVLYWPVDKLRETFTATQRSLGIDPDAAVQELTGDHEDNVEAFFARVFENLREGRARLVFVADIIPDELQRIVEFLNTQMSPAEVYAVEVKQYAAEGFAGRTIVPRVIGRTAGAMAKQGTGTPRLSAEEFREQASQEARDVSEKLGVWAQDHGYEVRETPQARTAFRPDGSVIVRLYYSFGGALDIDLVSVREQKGDEFAESTLHKLQALTAKNLSKKWPSIPVLDVQPRGSAFVTILDQIL